MDYTLPQPDSLRERSLIKAAITLWTKSPVLDKILKLFSRSTWNNRWKEIDKLVQKIIQDLELPDTFKAELSSISRQIGQEMLAWTQYYAYQCNKSVFLKNVCWTPQGSIDAEKTARSLVNDKSLTVFQRYKIACINCFDEMIPDLWKQCGVDEKDLEGMRKNTWCDPMVILWSYSLCGRSAEITGESSINEYGLNIAVERGNSVAVKYFWQKLTSIEKEKNLEKCMVTAARKSCDYVSGSTRFPNSCDTEIVCFLLNQVSQEEQKEILSNYDTAEDVLCGLLNFPYQKLFIPAADFSWNNSMLDMVLYCIKRKIDDPFQEYIEPIHGYRVIFNYFLNKIDDKNSIKMDRLVDILLVVFKLECYDDLKSILSDLFLERKEKFIFSYSGRQICYELIGENKWNVLKFIFESCLTNRNAILEFKEKERISCRLLEKGSQEEAQKFIKIVDDLISSFDVVLPLQENNKRKIEDDETQEKRMRTDSKITHVSVSDIKVRQIC